VVRAYIASGGKSFKDVAVKDAMIADLIVSVPDDDLNDVMAIMVEKNIRHLPVIDNGRVIGMLSIRDIIQTMSRSSTPRSITSGTTSISKRAPLRPIPPRAARPQGPVPQAP